MPRASAAKIDENAIREHAYYLWERDGRPFGRDVDYWMRAVSEASPKPRSRARPAATTKPRARRG